MPEMGINFQKKEEEIVKEIKINSRTSHQEIAMVPSLKKLQRQKRPLAQGLKGMVEESSGNFSQGFCKTRKGMASAVRRRRLDSNWE